ncbi:MAG: CRISPR-associated endonuclease Cas1 [Atopobiaceae bacterium]
MLTIEDVVSTENVQKALNHFAGKRDGEGPDGMRVSDLPSYWKANGSRVCQQLRDSEYRFGVVSKYEIISAKGKRRFISSIDVLDRFVERLLQQVLAPEFDRLFLPNSFAFQEGKGALDAAVAARDYVSSGFSWLCEVDLKDYFDWIPHSGLMAILRKHTQDPSLLHLLESCMRRDVLQSGVVSQLTRGVLQGCAVSPIFANLYLQSLDQLLQDDGWSWLRYADNINVYTKSEEDAYLVYEALSVVLRRDYRLSVNIKKSGVFPAISRRVLGYDLVRSEGGSINVCRHDYDRMVEYGIWHKSAIVGQQDLGDIHIVEDGILNREDFSILFQGDDVRRPIPAEVTDQLNIYGNVSVTPAALSTITYYNIRLAYCDKYGNLMGVYVPAKHGSLSTTFLKQVQLYCDDGRRLEVGRSLEDAGIHNMRSNLRYYYHKFNRPLLSNTVEELTTILELVSNADSMGELLILEAQARKRYYACFNDILLGTGFDFSRRSRRPPRDPANALISFGNTLLYNKFLQLIWKTSLDPRIGVIHSTNGRLFSLNLDFADVFKPIVVDRVIFSLVNKRTICSERDFCKTDEGGTYLNENGKRVFIQALQGKLASYHTEGSRRVSYGQLMKEEVRNFYGYVTRGTEFLPYKYPKG